MGVPLFVPNQWLCTEAQESCAEYSEEGREDGHDTGAIL
jgi:hypothetical protein